MLTLNEFDKIIDPRSVRVVLDVGSRDAWDAIQLKRRYHGANVYAFECNPPAIIRCQRNIVKYSHYPIILVEKAVSDVDGPVPFYAIDPEKTITGWSDGNIGASSLFIANPAYPVETYVQNEITVESITLKQWSLDVGIDVIDILWMDLQGAELMALKGMGDLINTVGIIYTEVAYKEMYFGQPLFDEFNGFLVRHGFHLHAKVNTSQWFGDALYVRTS